MNVVVRDERSSDAPAIRAVLEAAFSQAVEADLVDKLRAACHDRISLVACDYDRIVGHILFTPAIIDRPEVTVVGYGLAPMAVFPEFQRRGVGSALVHAGIERLRRSRCPFVIVVGHPAYYPRFGFVPASTCGIRCEWDGVPDEAFMVLVLEPSIASQLAGLARYRPEFGEAI
jgi:putative acetyltransferase